MTDDFDNLFDEPRPTAEIATRFGLAVLTLRPNSVHNLQFLADVLDRERTAKEPAEESEDVALATLTGDTLAAFLREQAIALHRRNVVSLTIAGTDRTADALAFVIALAQQDPIKFRDVARLANPAPVEQEASADAIAGE